MYQKSSQANLILKQFSLLCQQGFQGLKHNQFRFAIYILLPLLGAFLYFLTVMRFGRFVFDYHQGNAPGAVSNLFLLCIFVLVVGTLTHTRFNAFDGASLQKERPNGVGLGTYLIFKVVTTGLLAFYQAALFTILFYVAVEIPGGFEERMLVLFSLWAGSFTAIMLGMAVSALYPSPTSALWTTCLLIFTTIFLSNVPILLPSPFPLVSSTYWTFRNLSAISGIGADIARDDCWLFPPELRQEMTLEDKTNLECNCMGMKLFAVNSCEFPGIGDFYSTALDAPRPTEPYPPGNPPAEPFLPEAPAPPSNPGDKKAQSRYQQAQEEYQIQVSKIQNDFQLQVVSYKLRAELYRSQTESYQYELDNWITQREHAVSEAEASIAIMISRFGWSFVNKDDFQAYRSFLMESFTAQGVINLLLIGILWLSYKR